MSDVKRMNIAEFRALGLLQEVNRQFLHPLGLALEVIVDDETGDERLGGVWDYREDAEGIRYGGDLTPDPQKAARVADMQKGRRPQREALLGYWIQPVASVEEGA